jgi:tetratricopeptide (TPR) repeat protein
MRKIFPFLIYALSVFTISAQSPQADSLNEILADSKEDTVKVMALAMLSFYDQSFQRSLDFAKKGLALAKKIKYEKGEAECTVKIGASYWFISNYPMALHYYLEALKISERIHYIDGQAVAYYSMGVIYKEQGDYKNALYYLRKTESLTPADNYYRLACLTADFGDIYAQLNRQDSALKFYSRSYEYYASSTDKYQLNNTLNGLGGVQLKMGNRELALGYYREAIRNGLANMDTLGLSHSYLKIANLYYQAGQLDSSISYAGKSLVCAQKTNALQNVISSGKLLSKLFQNKNDRDALRYLQIAQKANDSLFSRERTMQIQNMSFNEAEREREKAEIEEHANKERKQNIQYALISLGIVSFIVVFFLLSRSIIVTEKWISFFGILGLLIVFEFLNLLIHPFLERATHHNPILMLLALVAIASFLIPLHHRIEKWVKVKMTEKNKKIRLANAMKTIEELKEKSTQIQDMN